jgi:hypothetical protein
METSSHEQLARRCPGCAHGASQGRRQGRQRRPTRAPPEPGKFVKGARRDSGKLGRTLERDIERLDYRLVLDAKVKPRRDAQQDGGALNGEAGHVSQLVALATGRPAAGEVARKEQRHPDQLNSPEPPVWPVTRVGTIAQSALADSLMQTGS